MDIYDLLDKLGLTLISNHSMTNDEILELFDIAIDNDTGDLIMDGIKTGYSYDDLTLTMED